MGTPADQWHRLSSVDVAARTAVCSKCGPIDIRAPRGKRGSQCGNVNRAGSRRQQGIKQSADERAKMIAAQDGKCAICATALGPTPCTDHDHETGRVRGILCHGCNVGLGFFRDDPALLRSAIRYLGA